MTSTLPIIDRTGAAVGEVALRPAWLERGKGEQAVHDAVVAFRAAQRAGTASAKSRGAIRGGGAKPWRQKGTGRARAGSNRSPLWRGGGVIFGPVPRDFDKKVNRKVRQLALRRAFTERVDAGDVLVLNEVALAEAKTKQATALLTAIGADDDALIVIQGYADNVNLELATRNLPRVSLLESSKVNAYHVLLHRKLVFTSASLEAFAVRLVKKKRAAAPTVAAQEAEEPSS